MGFVTEVFHVRKPLFWSYPGAGRGAGRALPAVTSGALTCVCVCVADLRVVVLPQVRDVLHRAGLGEPLAPSAGRGGQQRAQRGQRRQRRGGLQQAECVRWAPRRAAPCRARGLWRFSEDKVQNCRINCSPWSLLFKSVRCVLHSYQHVFLLALRPEGFALLLCCPLCLSGQGTELTNGEMCAKKKIFS